MPQQQLSNKSKKNSTKQNCKNGASPTLRNWPLPFLAKKFPNYSDFGGKTVEDIFGKGAIIKAELKRAELFGSCIFLNKGDGTFEIKKLPVLAQVSPVRDILVRDFNQDGKTDLVLVGNEYAVRPSMGRYDGSYGWCLLSDTGKSFKPLMPAVSGFKIKGDARRILPIDVLGKHFLVGAVNNGDLQIFEQLK